MFPTHVGMNRKATAGESGPTGVPHPRGDEPVKDRVFPTHVGMNRRG